MSNLKKEWAAIAATCRFVIFQGDVAYGLKYAMVLHTYTYAALQWGHFFSSSNLKYFLSY